MLEAIANRWVDLPLLSRVALATERRQVVERVTLRVTVGLDVVDVQTSGAATQNACVAVAIERKAAYLLPVMRIWRRRPAAPEVAALALVHTTDLDAPARLAARHAVDAQSRCKVRSADRAGGSERVPRPSVRQVAGGRTEPPSLMGGRHAIRLSARLASARLAGIAAQRMVASRHECLATIAASLWGATPHISSISSCSEYARMCAERLQQLSLLAEPAA